MSSRFRQSLDSALKVISSIGSKPEKRLGSCLPPPDRPICDRDGQLKHYSGWHVFASEHAKSHFIKAVLILLSENGTHDLNSLKFDNFYNRAYDEQGNIWYTASIVAMDDYAIRHTIMAPNSGATKSSAFQLLMLEVETRLGELLRNSSGHASTAYTETQIPQISLKMDDGGQQDMPAESIYPEDKPQDSEQVPAPLNINSVANIALNSMRRSFTLRT